MGRNNGACRARRRAHSRLAPYLRSYGAGGGLGLPIVGKLLGHTQASTTQRYAHLDADPLRRAANTIGATIAAAMEGTRHRASPNAKAAMRDEEKELIEKLRSACAWAAGLPNGAEGAAQPEGNCPAASSSANPGICTALAR